jgi:hypothetical protein
MPVSTGKDYIYCAEAPFEIGGREKTIIVVVSLLDKLDLW